MGFTYRNPERSTDPAAGGRRRPLDHRRRPLLPRRRRADRDRAGCQARVARYAWVDHYAPLRVGLRAIAQRLRAAGERAVAFADDNSIVDREVAYLAGLGWFGKNANMLLARRRQLVRARLRRHHRRAAASGEPVADGCGTCRRCLDGCPTGAIVAPGVVDANRCLAWLLQQPGTIPDRVPRRLGDRIYGCDDCQEVCPPTVRLGRRHRAPARRRGAEAWVDVLDLLDADDDALLERHGAGTWPSATRAGCAATRWSCSATPATPTDPRVVAALDALPRATPIDPRRARRWASATGSGGTAPLDATRPA